MDNKQKMLCHTTPRLSIMAKLLSDVHSVADIGCDHAYLPILLLKEDESKKVIASDIGEGPIRKARKNLERFGLDKKVFLRIGDGLKTLKAGETEAIVVAGMGADVIAGILKSGEKTAKSADFLVLQPMTGTEDLRRFLYENGYIIKEEKLVREDRRIYTIIVAAAGETGEFSDFDTYISPALIKDNLPLFKEYFMKKKRHIKEALEGICRARHIPKQKEEYYKNLLTEFCRVEGEIF